MRILLFAIALAFLACVAGCSKPYEGLPQLPQKDWLNPEKHEPPKDAEKLPIYSPDKTLGMEDLVWLAIQESPVISRGAINLEVQEINKRDAQWSYLPEMHLYYTISNNITRYNDDKFKNSNQDYGETAYQLSFGGNIRNPVATYFTNKAQDELMRVAIITQRKGIADVIRNIAASLLQINLLEETVDVLERQLAQADKKREFAEEREKSRFDAWNPASYNEDHAKDVELRLRETRLALTAERTRLKQLVGLDMKQALKVDAKSVFKLLDKINPQDMDWHTCWLNTEDRYLLQQQVRLEQANVMLAWAQYMPNIGIAVNENAPNGQSQPADGQTDEFLHLTIDMPILDWGHRWRMAEISGAHKRQRQLDEIQREREYGERWLAFEQDMMLAKARLERRENASANAHKRTQGMETAYSHGMVDIWALEEMNTRELDSQLGVLDAQTRLAHAKLSWIHFASGLSNYFLGKAGYEQDKK